jgi:type IX secretion system PorP/SprF family membrane protein
MGKMKQLSILIILSASVFKAQGQQDAMYSQYMFNYLAINPGYAGSRDVLSVTGLYRSQWANIDGAPTTMTFTADMPIHHERMGIGLSFFNDKIGVEQNTGVFATYAYRLRLTKRGTLSFGATAGFTQYRADLTGVGGNNTGIDNAFGANISTFNPNLGFGAYYSTDRFYLSLSVPHLLDSKLTDLTEISSLLRRHYFMGAGYVFTVSPSVALKPSFLIKVVEGAPIQGDININAWLVNKVGMGLSYRTGDAFAALLEFQLVPTLRFGYSYDITSSGLRRFAGSTHELMVRYEFATNKKKIVTPRYF